MTGVVELLPKLGKAPMPRLQLPTLRSRRWRLLANENPALVFSMLLVE